MVNKIQKRRLDCTALVGVLTAFSTVILIVQKESEMDPRQSSEQRTAA